MKKIASKWYVTSWEWPKQSDMEKLNWLLCNTCVVWHNTSYGSLLVLCDDHKRSIFAFLTFIQRLSVIFLHFWKNKWLASYFLCHVNITREWNNSLAHANYSLLWFATCFDEKNLLQFVGENSKTNNPNCVTLTVHTKKVICCCASKNVCTM